jgi:hypothetical protein
VNPARVGLLRIERPDEGTLNSVQCTSDSSVSPMENGVWEVLLRPSQPMAICADWSRPVDGAASSADLASVGPRAVGLAVDVTYASTILAPEKTGWTPEILARPAGMDLLATVRLTNLLQAARLLPIGARPPAWLRDELLDLGRAFRGSPQAGHLSVQVESLLDSWSRTSKFSSLHSVAPDAALVLHDSQRLLADSMFVAAADPDNSIAVPAGHSTWSISRRLFNGGFATAWFIFWSFVITKGGQWARQNELADRVAQRPAIVLFTIGVAWWLLLSPSSLGVMIAVAAVLWEAVSVVRRRRLRSALPSQ